MLGLRSTPLALALLLAIRARRAVRVLRDASRTGGKLASIRELDGRASRQMRAILGAKSLDRHHIARLQRVLSPALPVDHVRRAALESPVHHFAVLACHI